ncbi:MAG: tetratricopeptide repeat protein [Cyanobacteria bacterium SZAS-4]|nr:tetratricopeptide repeat protein [Cyanobacteria bacterium SZAS-4]
MSQWKLPRAAVFSLTISLAATIPCFAQGISEMGAVHGMGATMGAGLHSNAGAASGGLNNVYGSINKQLGGAASASSGGSSSALDTSGDLTGLPVDPRLTVATAGKASNHYYDLAVQKQKAGKNAEAEQLYLRSLSIRQSIWGNKDPAVWKIMGNIAALKCKRGDYAGAEQWYRVILTAELKHYGAGTYELVPMLEKMGQVSLQQKKYNDAQNYLLQVYTQRLRKFGLDGPETVASALDLSRAYSESGDLSSAAELLSKTVDAKLSDSGSPQMVKLLEAYMGVLKKQNKQEEFTRIESRLQTMKPVPVAKSEPAAEAPKGVPGTPESPPSAVKTERKTEVKTESKIEAKTTETKPVESKSTESKTVDAKTTVTKTDTKAPVSIDEFKKSGDK